MEEYRIDMKVRNNLLLDKIESEGYPSPYSFCEATGICYPNLCGYVNMSQSIYDTTGKIKKFIDKLCCELNCIPEEIFSASQMEASLKNNKKMLKVNEAEALFMLTQTDNQKLLEDHYYDDQLTSNVTKVLDYLTPKESKVLAMRMGLGNYEKEHTLDEVGAELDVSRERVRQIESKALRKLRHPSIADPLREFINVDYEVA